MTGQGSAEAWWRPGIARAPPGVESRPPPSLALVSDGAWGRNVAVSVARVVAVNEFHLEGGDGVGAYSRRHSPRCKLERLSGGSALSLFSPSSPTSPWVLFTDFPSASKAQGRI